MRQILSRSVLTVAAASGLLAAAGGYASADSSAHGTAEGSPGLLSGNNVSAPVEVPVNVCGNSVDAVGLLNPAFGNDCSNGTVASAHAQTPPPATPSPSTPAHKTPPRQVPPPRTAPDNLADTGAGGGEMGAAAAAAAALLFGGALLYRRGGRTAHARAGHAAGTQAARGSRAGHARR